MTEPIRDHGATSDAVHAVVTGPDGEVKYEHGAGRTVEPTAEEGPDEEAVDTGQ